ncbi:thioredoxin family protein [Pelagibacterium xiamenense]|uniref:thioredoxin family protein n=1 Tax=Pelagibacterium xiamenense TaxID=2901140 RepID=UPI001E56D6FA|nr:thioredoxin family protein [Pelagibacterium xiamenense]MCD7060558.1 thioredoxin family protein [Pelagibacterium xiamenense]
MTVLRRTVMGLLLMLVSLPAMAQEVVHEVYSEALVEELDASGQPYILDFYASWCVTCAAQQRVIGALQAENEAYREVTVVQVDWDTHREGPLVAELGIPRRSTLVLMRGGEEIMRLVADTRRDAIEGLFAAAN